MIRHRRDLVASIVVAAVLTAAVAVPVKASPLSERAPEERVLEVHDRPSAGSIADLTVTPDGVDSDVDLLVDRIAGENRYHTAVLISQALYPDGTWPDGSPVDAVVVTNGMNFPDALAGGPYAAGIGPLLLVPPSGTVPQVVLDELDRLGPTYIDILGSTDAVGSGIESQLAGTGAQITRIAGRNRYDTAAQLARATFDRRFVPDPSATHQAIIASGEVFADALGASAISAVGGHVLLLGSRGGLSDETWAVLEEIRPVNVFLLGSGDRLPLDLERQVAARLPSGTWVGRIAGSDRFETAAMLSRQTIFDSWVVENTRMERSYAEFPVLADGFGFPDALASTPLAWAVSSPILLGRQTCLSLHTVDEVERLQPEALIVVGGTDRISDEALAPVVCR
jgi:putative cell wall-binding protein